MTYNVFSGTLNPTHLTSLSRPRQIQCPLCRNAVELSVPSLSRDRWQTHGQETPRKTAHIAVKSRSRRSHLRLAATIDLMNCSAGAQVGGGSEGDVPPPPLPTAVLPDTPVTARHRNSQVVFLLIPLAVDIARGNRAICHSPISPRRSIILPPRSLTDFGDGNAAGGLRDSRMGDPRV